MQTPIGVVIPVFNRPHQVARVLESVLAQTAPAHQVVVVDDGSTDETADVAERWAAERVLPFDFCLIRQQNQGAAAARNAGFAALRHCTRVLFLDSDDRLASDFLARADSALNGGPGAVLALADILDVTADDHVGKTMHAAEIAAHPLRYMFRWGTGGFLSASLIDTAAARRAGLFPDGYPTGQDTVFLCRVAQLGVWLALPGTPCLRATYLGPTGSEEAHLSHRYPDRYRRWADMFGQIYQEIRPCLPRADRFILRRSIGRRYHYAATYARRTGRPMEALPHLLRAAWHAVAARAELLGRDGARPDFVQDRGMIAPESVVSGDLKDDANARPIGEEQKT